MGGGRGRKVRGHFPSLLFTGTLQATVDYKIVLLLVLKDLFEELFRHYWRC
jgi:hypothetical protein